MIPNSYNIASDIMSKKWMDSNKKHYQ